MPSLIVWLLIAVTCFSVVVNAAEVVVDSEINAPDLVATPPRHPTFAQALASLGTSRGGNSDTVWVTTAKAHRISAPIVVPIMGYTTGGVSFVSTDLDTLAVIQCTADSAGFRQYYAGNLGFRKLLIQDCSTPLAGAAIWVDPQFAVALQIEGCEFRNNSAFNPGGAISG